MCLPGNNNVALGVVRGDRDIFLLQTKKTVSLVILGGGFYWLKNTEEK